MATTSASPTSIPSALRPVTSTSRRLYLSGAVLLASGVVHVPMLAASGFQWQGAVSWRKPIVFGLSVGMLLVTVGWIMDRLDPDDGRVARWLGWTLLVSAVVEVALITSQTWRGEASHFNIAEPTNAAIFAAMGASVVVMSLCLVIVFVWVVRRRPSDPVLSLALVAGMALVLVGLGVGQWIIEVGNDVVAATGVVPATVTTGDAGVPKFPHALALHGIQVFIFTALALQRTPATSAARLRAMRVVVGSTVALTVLAVIQAIVGSAPGAWSWWTLVQGGTAAVLVGQLALVAVRARSVLLPHRREPVPSPS